MSNPSSEKAPVLKWEQPIEDKRGSDQQTQDRLHESVHKARIEQVKETDNKEQPRAKLIGGVKSDNIIDRQGKLEEVNNVPPGYHKIENTAQTADSSYPPAQPSYDAAGKLDHIDFMPNKNR